MSRAPIISAEPRDSSGCLLRDTFCRGCAYNLRGLPLTGQCPECSAPVALSIQNDLLRYSPPGWIKTLIRGTQIQAIGSIISVVTFLFIRYAFPRSRNGTDAYAATSINFVVHLLTAIGLWLLTEPEPSGTGEDRYGSQRRVARICMVVGMIEEFSYIWLEASALPQLWGYVKVVVTFFVLGIVTVGSIAKYRYLGKLCQRLPDVNLERKTFMFLFVYAGYRILYVLQYGFFAAFYLGWYNFTGITYGIYRMANSLTTPMVIIMGTWLCILMYHFGKSLKKQLILSEKNYSTINTGSKND